MQSDDDDTPPRVATEWTRKVEHRYSLVDRLDQPPVVQQQLRRELAAELLTALEDPDLPRWLYRVVYDAAGFHHQRAAELALLTRSGREAHARAGKVAVRPPAWRIAVTVLFVLAIIGFIVVMLNNGAKIPVW